MLHYLPVFRDYNNKLRPFVKKVPIIFTKIFGVTETSNEPLRTSNYVRYVNNECMLQLLATNYSSINDDCMFKISKLESTLCNDCGHASNNDGVYIN